MPTSPFDADAFTAAFAQHGRTLWVLAAAWVGRAEADDLVQEVARVAWQVRERFEAGSDVRAWLAQIARHTGANWRRRRRPESRDPASMATAFAVADPRAEPASVWPFDADRHGLSDELAHALGGLLPTARACLLLHVVAELTHGAIGSMLELPANTVASHVRRAREALRVALSTPTATPTPLPEYHERS